MKRKKIKINNFYFICILYTESFSFKLCYKTIVNKRSIFFRILIHWYFKYQTNTFPIVTKYYFWNFRRDNNGLWTKEDIVTIQLKCVKFKLIVLNELVIRNTHVHKNNFILLYPGLLRFKNIFWELRIPRFKPVVVQVFPITYKLLIKRDILLIYINSISLVILMKIVYNLR